MVDQRIVDYVRNGLRAGYKAADLKRALQQQGWPETDVDQAVQLAQGQAKQTPQAPGVPTTHMGLLTKMKKILISPSEFFEAAKADHLAQALGYYAIVLLIPTIIMVIIAVVAPTVMMSAFSPESADAIGGLGMLAGLMTGMAVLMAIGMYFMALVATFISAGLYHVLVLLFGGRKPYSETYKAFTYSSTPFLIIGWIALPLILVHFYAYAAAVFAIALWSIRIMIIGFSKLQEISWKRSLMIILLPIIIVLAITGFIFASFGSLSSGLAGTEGKSFVIPAGGTFCTNGRINVVLTNMGKEEISADDWILNSIKDESRSEAGTLSVSSISSRQSKTFTSDCGGRCREGSYTIQLGTISSSQSVSVTCRPSG